MLLQLHCRRHQAQVELMTFKQRPVICYHQAHCRVVAWPESQRSLLRLEDLSWWLRNGIAWVCANLANLCISARLRL